MKKTVLSLALASATLFLGAARADDPKPAPASALTAGQTELLNRYDTNHDGQIDEAEMAAGRKLPLKDGGGEPGARQEKVRAVLLKLFDKNGDGQLDESERAEMKKFFLRFDKNGDGKLDDNERAAMREQLKAEAKAKRLKN